jgi:uncharacterized membrane protein YidH (DUF202 family)
MKNAKTIAGLILIILGVLVLIYGGFNYTKDTHDAELGPIKLQVQEKDRLEIPVWLGVVVVAAGTVVLLLGNRKT